MTSGQTRSVQAGRLRLRSEYEREASASPQVVNTWAGTKRCCGSCHLPVPYTDTGGLVEETQADERTLVKELGKLIPYLRKKGCSRGCTPWRWKPAESRRVQAHATGYQNLRSLRRRKPTYRG
jgi:hypothetical protein